MKSGFWLIIGGVAWLGAASPAIAQQADSAQLAALRSAKDCVANVSRFGRIGGSLYTPNGTIQTPNDGGWCWVQIAFTWRGGATVPSLKVTQAPEHGELMFGSVDQKVRLAYHPKPGFTGTDAFTVGAQLPDQVWDVPVKVTVTP